MPGGPDDEAQLVPAGRTEPTAARSGAGYELSTEPEKAAIVPSKCPSCNQPLKAGAVICLNCGFHTQDGTHLETAVATPVASADSQRIMATETGPSRFVGLHLPIGLVVLGVLLSLVNSLFFSENPLTRLATAVAAVGINIVVSIPLYLLGIAITAKSMQTSFGPLHLALLKLAAIAFGPAAFGTIVKALLALADDTGTTGAFVGFLVEIVLYWSLFTILFSLDLFETMVCVFVIWLINLASGMALGVLMMTLFL